jgi:hypothetical protein
MLGVQIMPPVVAAIASTIAGFVAGGFGLAAASNLAIFAATNFVVSSLIYAGIATLASRFLIGKPKNPDLPNLSADPLALLRNTDGPITSHHIVFGTRRKGSQLAYKTTTDFGLNSNGVEVTGANQFYHYFLAIAGHECESITKIFFDDEQIALDGNGFVTTDRYVDSEGLKYARIKIHLGANEQIADSFAVSEIPEWTTNHRGRGICYLYVRLQYNKDVWEKLPKITVEVKGAKVYDPRTSTTVWSNNPALCIRDYLVSNYGFEADATTEINDTYTIAAANACEEQVILLDSTTQDRYTCDVVLDRGAALIDNLDILLSSLVGACPYVQGEFRIFAGEYNVPTVTVDETWLAGEIAVTTRQNRKELFNAVKGVYINEEKNYFPSDFPAMTNPTYEEEDGGQRIFTEVELSATTNQERAQRIAKIILEKSRQGIIVNLPLNFKALEIACWDTIYLTIQDLGWSSKVFRVLTWQLLENGEGINFICQEESSQSYEWEAGEATVIDPVPDTELPSAFDITPPGNPQINEEKYITINGNGTKAKAIVSWDASPDAFVSEYQLEYKLNSDSDYIVVFRGDALYAEIFDIKPGLYTFRVKAINSIGVSSDYATSQKEIFGLSDIPENITNFSLNMIHNNAHLRWDLSPDLDVKVGGRIIIKHTTDTVSPTWSTAVLIVPAQPGYSTQVVAPLVPGVYLIKAEDSEGNQSVTAETITIIQNNIVKMNQIAVSTQNPDFTGVKNNTVVVDDSLKLDGAGLFDDTSGLFDDAVGLFDGGNGVGFVTSGSYVFDAPIDTGRVTTSRVTIKIKSLITDGIGTFDEAEGLFDDRMGLFDGEDIDGIEIKSFIRQTDDDPTGTPSWTDWKQFVSGDYTARGFDFKIEIESQDASLNVAISELVVEIDVPDITDSGSALSSASSAVTIPFNKTFVKPTPVVGITQLAGSTGDYWLITNINSTSFDIEIFNSVGTRVIRGFNWNAQGY